MTEHSRVPRVPEVWHQNPKMTESSRVTRCLNERAGYSRAPRVPEAGMPVTHYLYTSDRMMS